MDETIRMIVCCLLGAVIGGWAIYTQYVSLDNLINELKKIARRQDEVELRQAELGETILQFFADFKTLLLAEQERRRQEQTNTKDKDNG